MKRTIGGITAVVASLWAGCSSEDVVDFKKLGFQEIFVKTYDPEHYFNRLVERTLSANFMGVGCPIYGGMHEVKTYNVPLSEEDINTTGGDHSAILEISTNRILKKRGLNGGPETEEARQSVEFFLPRQNPRFYDHHKFKAGEIVRYAVFHSDGVGGTINCTL